MDNRSRGFIILFAIVGAATVLGTLFMTSGGKIQIPTIPGISGPSKILDFSTLASGTDLVVTKPRVWQADAGVTLKVSGTEHPVGSLVSTSQYAAALRLNFTGGPGAIGDWISIKWYIRQPVNWAIYMTNWAGTPYEMLYGITNAYGDIRTSYSKIVAASKFAPELSSGSIVEAKFMKTNATGASVTFTIYSGGLYGTGVNKGYGNEVVLSTKTVHQNMASNLAPWKGMVFSCGGVPSMEFLTISTSWNAGII